MCCFIQLVLFTILLTFTNVQSTRSRRESVPDSEKVQPAYLQDGKLAARLTCQPKEIRHFRYESESQLWGEAGGKIRVSADMAVHCLGADHGGKYGAEALKYLVELSNIRGIPENGVAVTGGENRGPNSALRRSKRGVGSFFKSTWTKVKCFFKRLFGNGCSDGHSQHEDEHTPPPHEETTVAAEGPAFRDNGGNSQSGPTEPPPEIEVFDPAQYEQEYTLPFEFVQLANGSVPEIRFAANESIDNGARPFKRHLTDVFNTNLDRVRPSVEEVSPLGTHKTRYSYKTPESQSASTTEPSSPDDSDRLTVTRKLEAGDLMSLPTDDPKMNDINDLQVVTKQIQTFSAGEMIASNGVLELSISNELGRNRRRRSALPKEEDLTSNLDVKTSFTLQLKKRHKREVEDITKINDLEKIHNFKGESLSTVQKADSFSKNRLESLRDKFKDETAAAKYVTDDDYLANTESISTLLEILELENKLEQDKQPNSLTPLVKSLVNSEKITDLCITLRSKNCRTALLLLASSGGSHAEKTLLYLVQQPYIQAVALLSATCSTLVPRPSQFFVESLLKEVENKMRRVVVRSALANTVSLLAIKRVNKVFYERHLAQVLKQQTEKCKESELAPSLLDALGNMGVSQITKEELISLAKSCLAVESYQTGVIHALKGSLDDSDVQAFLIQTLDSSKQSCPVRRAVLEVLRGATKNEKLAKAKTWPGMGTNDVDLKLTSILASSEPDPCSKATILEYFQLKEEEPALANALGTFGTKQNVTRRVKRHRRQGFLDSESCDDWTRHRQGKSKSPIDGFEVEGETYNRWSHCNSESYFGRRLANAEFTGGMFAGVKHPSNPRRYKVEARMNGEAHFLGKKFQVSNIKFGLDEKSSNAYVKLLGRTLLDLKETDHQDVSADEFVYRPAEHIPLYTLNIWIVEVALGIHLGVDAQLNFKRQNRNIFEFHPSSRIRVGGEGIGRILMLRGGINLGGNFNYHIRSRLQPYPQACFSGKHGFDPMSISIETWYQHRTLFSADRWSRRKLWSPNFLKWDVGHVGEAPWTKLFCAIPTDLDTAPSDTEIHTEPNRDLTTTINLEPGQSNSGNRPLKPAESSTTVPPNPAGGSNSNNGGKDPATADPDSNTVSVPSTQSTTTLTPATESTPPPVATTKSTAPPVTTTQTTAPPVTTTQTTAPPVATTQTTAPSVATTQSTTPTVPTTQKTAPPITTTKSTVPPIPTVLATVAEKPETTTDAAEVVRPHQQPVTNPELPSPSPLVIESTTIPMFVVKAP